jgi:alpha-beta hydrolase superfamily lysophospholipase
VAPARIVLHHGVGTNARMMSIVVGQHLAAQGFDVSAVDMPFFGATSRAASRVIYDDWVSIGAHYIESILAKDDMPTLLFGFSAGGMLSYHIACVTQRVAGICGTCFLDMRDAVVRRDIAPMPRLNAAIEIVGRGVARMLPDLSLPLHVVSNMRALTNDAAMTRLLLRDPGAAGVKLPLCFLRSFIEYRPAIEPEDFEVCPIQLLHPGQDRWTALTASMRFLDRVKAPTAVTIIRGAGHLPITSESLGHLRDGTTDFVRDQIDNRASGALDCAA